LQAFFVILEGIFHFMIKCHLSRLMGEKKLKIADVARDTGLNRNTITLLYKETANRIELDTIEKLCELFECEVSDLLEYSKDG
jgi:putative transcriptional regulator